MKITTPRIDLATNVERDASEWHHEASDTQTGAADRGLPARTPRNKGPNIAFIVLTLAKDEDLFAGLVRNLEEQLTPFRFEALQFAPGMAAGYNALAGLAAGGPDDVLCFIHQDARLFFDACDVIPQYLARLPHAGVLGFCGSNNQQPGRQWHECPPCYGGLVQGRDHPIRIEFTVPPGEVAGLRYAEVHTLDGFCLFVRREVFDHIGGFDEEYRGWHGYDIDFCMRALDAGYCNYVIAQPSQHYSWGSRDDDLARSMGMFAHRWAERLAANAAPSPPATPRALKIHVYAIARNEEKFAARFARSCTGADGVAVLDTGSDDRTVVRYGVPAVDCYAIEHFH